MQPLVARSASMARSATTGCIAHEEDKDLVPARIERDVLIEAPVDVVWRVVTESTQLERWFCDSADFELRPGGKGVITFMNKATNKPVTVAISVVAVEPPRAFSYRWCHPDGEEPRPDNSTLVEFLLIAEAGGTRLRVVESGLDVVNWPDHQKSAFVEDHTKGWETHLGSARAYAARERRTSSLKS
jgi:uncharacterized protein YndB with AHSA1/START domain